MKRALAVLIIIGIALPLIALPLTVSVPFASKAQTTQTRNDILGLESHSGNAGNNAASCSHAAGTERNLEGSAFSSEQPQSKSEQTWSPPPGPGASSPDGAIYLGGEPPYAYIPTYDPREKGFPKIPLEPEN